MTESKAEIVEAMLEAYSNAYYSIGRTGQSAMSAAYDAAYAMIRASVVEECAKVADAQAYFDRSLTNMITPKQFLCIATAEQISIAIRALAPRTSEGER